MSSSIDIKGLNEAGARLGEVAIDPGVWPELMTQISIAIGAAGASLLQSDVRTSDVPHTAALDEVFSNYFAQGWHKRDIRAERGVPLLMGGQKVVTDQDIVTPDEMNRYGIYTEALGSFGFKWFAVVGFWAGSALWGLSIQRTVREGPFEREQKRALEGLSRRLSETATLSQAVGRVVLSGMTNALDLIARPAIAIDRFGFVLDVNTAAEEIFDDEFYVKNRRIVVSDQHAKATFRDLIDQLRYTLDTATLSAEPMVIRRSTKWPLVIRVLPVDGAARSPFLGARALLVVSDLCRPRHLQATALMRAFGLSPAEARLASVIGNGASPERAAEELGIARETARNQLKAVFAKTGTNRQSTLVALLSRL